MEQKLDELLVSFNLLKKVQQDNQSAMTKKLKQLERDIQAGQDVVAEYVVKKLKQNQGYEFRKKGNEHQFIYNDGIRLNQCSIVLFIPDETCELSGFYNPPESSGRTSRRCEGLGI